MDIKKELLERAEELTERAAHLTAVSNRHRDAVIENAKEIDVALARAAEYRRLASISQEPPSAEPDHTHGVKSDMGGWGTNQSIDKDDQDAKNIRAAQALAMLGKQLGVIGKPKPSSGIAGWSMKGPDGDIYRVWDGGAQPEETKGKRVKVVYRGAGDSDRADRGIAEGFRWQCTGWSGDIIGYRVL